MPVKESPTNNHTAIKRLKRVGGRRHSLCRNQELHLLCKQEAMTWAVPPARRPDRDSLGCLSNQAVPRQPAAHQLGGRMLQSSGKKPALPWSPFPEHWGSAFKIKACTTMSPSQPQVSIHSRHQQKLIFKTSCLITFLLFYMSPHSESDTIIAFS